MNDSELMQRFRINALHGNDVGVLVCEGSGISISPCLFMLSVCPALAPHPLFVKWKNTIPPPKAFRKAGTLPLIYSDCGRVPPWPYYLHLFSPQMPAARSFEQESGWQDWSFPVRMIGLVVIFDKKHDAPLSWDFLSWLIKGPQSAAPKKNSSLDWVRAQQLPYVIAALGYDDAPSSEDEFRSRYGIAADIPIVPGPDLADEKKPEGTRSSAQDNLLSSVLGPRRLAFDEAHARAVLGALFRLTAKKR